MKRPVRPLHPVSRRRPVWTALLGLLLLFGALDFHPAGEFHPLLEPLGGGAYSSEAVHPEQPLHIEPGEAAHRPHCTVCIQRHQLGGLALRPAATLALPAARPLIAAPLDAPTVRGTFRTAGARAPPLA